MSIKYCVKCQKEHEHFDWTFRCWMKDSVEMEGWGCNQKFKSYPEFVPDRIKEERVEYLKSTIQPYRGNEFSKEYKELYPDRAKSMLKEGVITQKQYDKPKNVWKDLKGYNNLERSK